MSLLLIAENRDMKAWKDTLLEKESDLDIEIWPEVKKSEHVQFAVAWRHPSHSLTRFPNLKVVSSLGAGVDHILNDKTLPKGIKICRVVDTGLTDDMIEYMTTAVLNYRLNSFAYYRQKMDTNWQTLSTRRMDDFTVGVMGLGEIGLPVAKNFAKLGYKVNGWSNSKKVIKNICTYCGKFELDDFLQDTDLVICLLPLTADTKDILNIDLFKKMKHPGYLINAGRGAHLVEEDLIYALDKNWLEGAQLDVFNEEPLPRNHLFWNRENIIITPHISAETNPSSAANQIIENYKRTISGLPLINEVDIKRQY